MTYFKARNILRKWSIYSCTVLKVSPNVQGTWWNLFNASRIFVVSNDSTSITLLSVIQYTLGMDTWRGRHCTFCDVTALWQGKVAVVYMNTGVGNQYYCMFTLNWPWRQRRAVIKSQTSAGKHYETNALKFICTNVSSLAFAPNFI